jgi:regulator of protease activity HflC (stomatin/prohibitin superfamily)
MKIFNFMMLIVASLFAFTSCTSVPSGHKGVKVQWGGKTDLNTVYDEGLYSGISWMWNEMVSYDCREQTVTQDYEFNDKTNMLTGVEIALDWNRDPSRVNVMHTQIADLEIKLEKTLKSAAKEVIPQYTSVELNITKRQEAEDKLGSILESELPEIFCVYRRVQITDVDIPQAISQLAEQTAQQIERNKLAQKKEAEQTALAKAQVAKAKGEAESARFKAEAARLMSTPAVLKLKELEIQMKWAEKGVSPYGNNNVFGEGVVPLKMLNN